MASLFRRFIRERLYNQSLTDVRLTGAGIKCLHCTYIHFMPYKLFIFEHALIADWSKALPTTASWPSPFPESEPRPGQVRILQVTMGWLSHCLNMTEKVGIIDVFYHSF